jgi:hypothetical protein
VWQRKPIEFLYFFFIRGVGFPLGSPATAGPVGPTVTAPDDDDDEADDEDEFLSNFRLCPLRFISTKTFTRSEIKHYQSSQKKSYCPEYLGPVISKIFETLQSMLKHSLRQFYFLESQPMFRRNMSPPSSGSKINQARCQHESRWQRTTRRHIPEEKTLHNHLYENIKSYHVYS